MPKTYNFGIIGAGFIGDFHAQAIQQLPNAKLVAACTAPTRASPSSPRSSPAAKCTATSTTC